MSTHPDAQDAYSRISTVLCGLTPEEQAVALFWARTGDSWEHAALETGLSAAYGERVRRKLKRLGSQHVRRSSASADISGRGNR